MIPPLLVEALLGGSVIIVSKPVQHKNISYISTYLDIHSYVATSLTQITSYSIILCN